MFGASLTGLNRKRLRLWLTVFFLALAIPTGFLVYQAYSQLKWEAFHQHRVLAEELAARIDDRITELINAEEARPFSDYAFLNVAGDPASSFLQRSPLSAWPPASFIPGLVGYFQVDANGKFTTPLVPSSGTATLDYGISSGELEQRLALQRKIEQILSRNRLVQESAFGSAPGGKAVAGVLQVNESRQGEQTASPAVPQMARDKDAALQEVPATRAALAKQKAVEQLVTGQGAFDLLNQTAGSREQETKPQAAGALGRVEDLKLDYRYQSDSTGDIQRQVTREAPAPARRQRKERSVLPEPVLESGATFSSAAQETGKSVQSAPEGELHVRTFESEIDPFEFSLLDSGQFVLFRKVWRDGQRFIQGALIEQQPFIKGLIEIPFLDTALSNMSDLVVGFRGAVLESLSGKSGRDYQPGTGSLNGTLLYKTHLSAPLGDMELILSINRLPVGAGARVITWLAAILVLVLCGGFYLMYRLGAGQIDLTRQQQDFVSAVSHELKTPLTSIRMYGEMLREGWASEEKKKLYYEYIFDESERLSRLIANVLQLARMTRNHLRVETKPVVVAELMDGIQSRVAAQVARAGFELNMDCNPEAGQTTIQVDPDGFLQIFINLVDNAIKFSVAAERKAIDIGCEQRRDGSVQFGVRDYGAGVPRDQMKKIFRLFYRSESELTRETVGTGIGLALVHQLARAMGGEVDVVNREPGAEFRVTFTRK